jgi:PAS domain S-box-containing protein
MAETDIKVLETGEPVDAPEHTVRLADGGSRLRHIIKLPLRGEDGNVVGIVSLSEDITERKQAENALQKREQLLWRHNQALLELVKHGNLNRSDLTETLSDLTEVAAQTLDVERCGVWVFDEDRSTIRCINLYEKSKKLHSDGVELHAADFPSYFKALNEERSIAANDAHADPRTREFSESYLTPLGISSMMDAPVWLGGKMTGILCHEHVGKRREWSLEEQAFAGHVADVVAMAMESSERKRAEQELRASQRLLRTVFDTIPHSLMVRDKDGHYIMVNKALASSFNLEVTDFSGKHTMEVPAGAAADREEFLEGDRKVLESGEPLEVPELTVTLGTGEKRLRHVIKLPLHDESGEVVGVVGVSEDITERRKGEQEVRASQRLLQTVFDTIPHPVFVKDESSKYMMVNQAMVARFNLQAGDFPGVHTMDIMTGTEEERTARVEKDREVLATGKRVEVPESTLTLPDGDQRIQKVTKLPLLDDAGKVVGVVGISEDITEEKQREKALRESEERFRDFAGIASDWFWELDADLRYVYVSDRFDEKKGIRTEELLGRNRLDTDKHVEDVELWKEHKSDLAGRGPFRDFTYPYEDDEGRVRYVKINGKPRFDNEGAFLGYRGVGTDITELKRVEAAQQARNKVLERLAAGAPFDELLSVLTETAEADNPEMLASVLILDTKKNCLRRGAAPSLPDFYNEAIDGIEVGAQVGSCGAAAFTGERVIVEDVLTHPNWTDFREVATKAGLRACWSEPILSSTGSVLGTFAMYYREPRGPSQSDIEYIQTSAHIAGIAIEQKRKERALRLSERTQALGQEIARLGSWSWDQRREEVHWSDELYRILGCEPQEFEGSYETIMRFVHPEDKEHFASALKSALRGEAPYDFEHRVVRADGETREVHELAQVSLDEMGKPKQVVGTIHDITERKLAQTALQESELRLRTLIENIPVILFSLDPAGKVLSSAGKGLPRANLAPGDLVERSAFEFVSRYPEIDQDIRRALEGEEVTSERRIGKTFFEFRYTPLIDAEGRLTSVIGLAIDITERTRIEKELAAERRNLEETVIQRTQELKESLAGLADTNLQLQQANLAKSRFLSSMSHELRTPLNGILGFAELLRGQHFGALNEKQLHHVNQIDGSGNHLLSLINDVLDIAKIDAGGMEVELEAIAVKEFLQDIAAMMSSQFNKKKIGLQISCDPQVSTLYADGRKFRQIMLNLLSNAVKFTPEGGHVEIRGEQKDGERIRISIRDSGIGIEKVEIEDIFSEFHQASKVRDGHFGGTGMGLALTKRLVELHGGQIGVESTPGKGSTFWFHLPLREAPGETQAPQAQTRFVAAKTSETHRILVAEDNEVNLALILDMLSIHGHEMTVARNGLEAIELAKSQKPELILMDVRMPVMSGLEATRKLREIPAFEHIPIIALTASTGSEAETRQLEAGFSEHLAKPIQTNELFGILKKYLA